MYVLNPQTFVVQLPLFQLILFLSKEEQIRTFSFTLWGFLNGILPIRLHKTSIELAYF